MIDKELSGMDTNKNSEWNCPLTKLFVPVLPQKYLVRARLSKLYTMLSAYKITLVSAPAGYGKSTFLSYYLTGTKHPMIWISLDHRDDDFSRFWGNFITAIQRIEPGLGERSLSILQKSEPSFENALTELINEIIQTIPDLIIVFDDYHEITNTAVHDSVTFLMDYLPPRAHLFISSRIDPPLPIARLRACGYLYEVRPQYLQFTQEETESYLNSTMELSLTNEQIDIIHARTEGWIVGLQMVAVSILSGGSTRFLDALNGVDSPTMEYLANEVLEKQDESIRRFLLETSILENFNSSLCDAVTDCVDSQNKLDQLKLKQLFLQPIDNEGKWFRYHHLFRVLLQNHLQNSEPEVVNTLHKRASKWYERQGRIEEAIDHALTANDYESAEILIQRFALVVAGQDKHRMVQEWVAKLPQQYIAKDLATCILGGTTCEVFRKPEEAMRYRQYAKDIRESIQTQSTSPSLELQTSLGFLASFEALGLYHQRDILQAKQLSLEWINKLPEDEKMARCVLIYFLGFDNWVLGELEESFAYFDEACRLSRTIGYDFITATSIAAQAHIRLAQGHLLSSLETCQEVITFGSNKPDLESGVECYALLILGNIYYQWNKLEQSRTYILKAIEQGKKLQEPIIRINGLICLARIDLAQGNFDSAIEISRQAFTLQSEILGTAYPGYSNITEVFLTRLWLQMGNIAVASDYADRWSSPISTFIQELSPNSVLPDELRFDLYGMDVRDIWVENRLFTFVRLRIYQKKFTGLLGFLDIADKVVGKKGLQNLKVEILILKSLIYYSQGKLAHALRVLENVLLMTETEKWTRIFVDEGAPMYHLLKHAASRGIAPQSVSRILRAFPEVSSAEKESNLMGTIAQGKRSSSPTGSLTAREIEILKLIMEGLSNKQIAEKLVIAIPTVKNHLQVIYQKLDVNSRGRAIARVHELGLFVTPKNQGSIDQKK